MPKVNARFFTCPNCKNIKFVKKVSTVFLYNEDNSSLPGVPYTEETFYECLHCGNIIKDNGGIHSFY